MLKLSIFFMLMLVTELYADVIKLNPQAMTDAHNELRKKYNSPPLSYSNSLQAVAEKWAKTLQREGCRMRHSMGETGENIYWASPHTTIKTDGNNIKTRSSRLQNITDKNVVQSWYDEVKWYDYDTNRCKKGKMCGHYTQVIWHTTQQLGCAAIACKDKSQIWLCEYAPAGNINMHYRDGTIKIMWLYLTGHTT